MCGDNRGGGGSNGRPHGSPPRVWGQRLAVCCRSHQPRFTPTCVGTTCSGAGGVWGVSVHPHVCGDNPTKIEEFYRSDGSPPRVWGQRGNAATKKRDVRFTPTCVGTTLALPVFRENPAVHPHVCGDNECYNSSSHRTGGSPPRVWGQQSESDIYTLYSRFTPTCVGTTSISPIRSWSFSVHPHVCGDNSGGRATTKAGDGSPPRVWGQLFVTFLLTCNRRFTPTCVGTTREEGPRPKPETVHPHVCGDNLVVGCITRAVSGSPPRVWGQLSVHRRRVTESRFTPTCVGTTAAVRSACVYSPVHPHVCGDNVTVSLKVWM